jgi:hypothetical protein
LGQVLPFLSIEDLPGRLAAPAGHTLEHLIAQRPHRGHTPFFLFFEEAQQTWRPLSDEPQARPMRQVMAAL